MKKHIDIRLKFLHAALLSQLENYYLSKDHLNYTGCPVDAIAISENDPHRYPIVIEKNGTVTGFFVLHDWEGIKSYSTNKHALLLRAYSIDSKYQGKGIAKQSLKVLPDFVKGNFPDVNEVILAVNHQNTHAQHVYKSCGFKDKGIRVMGRKGEQFVFHMNV